MANVQHTINPTVKSAIFEALQAGVSDNAAFIKEAESYLKTLECTPVFHLTLIVSIFYVNSRNTVLTKARTIEFRKSSQTRRSTSKSAGCRQSTSKTGLINTGERMPPSKFSTPKPRSLFGRVRCFIVISFIGRLISFPARFPKPKKRFSGKNFWVTSRNRFFRWPHN